MRIKLYINHDKKERECGNCREVKEFKFFSYNNATTPKPTCKKCRGIEERNRHVEKAIDKYPDKYKYCESDNCLKIYSVTRLQCPECKKENNIKLRKR